MVLLEITAMFIAELANDAITPYDPCSWVLDGTVQVHCGKGEKLIDRSLVLFEHLSASGRPNLYPSVCFGQQHVTWTWLPRWTRFTDLCSFLKNAL